VNERRNFRVDLWRRMANRRTFGIIYFAQTCRGVLRQFGIRPSRLLGNILLRKGAPTVLDGATRGLIEARFSQSIEGLEALLGRPIPAWRVNASGKVATGRNVENHAENVRTA